MQDPPIDKPLPARRRSSVATDMCMEFDKAMKTVKEVENNDRINKKVMLLKRQFELTQMTNTTSAKEDSNDYFSLTRLLDIIRTENTKKTQRIEKICKRHHQNDKFVEFVHENKTKTYMKPFLKHVYSNLNKKRLERMNSVEVVPNQPANTDQGNYIKQNEDKKLDPFIQSSLLKNSHTKSIEHFTTSNKTIKITKQPDNTLIDSTQSAEYYNDSCFNLAKIKSHDRKIFELRLETEKQNKKFKVEQNFLLSNSKKIQELKGDNWIYWERVQDLTKEDDITSKLEDPSKLNLTKINFVYKSIHDKIQNIMNTYNSMYDKQSQYYELKNNVSKNLNKNVEDLSVNQAKRQLLIDDRKLDIFYQKEMLAQVEKKLKKQEEKLLRFYNWGIYLDVFTRVITFSKSMEHDAQNSYIKYGRTNSQPIFETLDVQKRNLGLIRNNSQGYSQKKMPTGQKSVQDELFDGIRDKDKTEQNQSGKLLYHGTKGLENVFIEKLNNFYQKTQMSISEGCEYICNKYRMTNKIMTEINGFTLK